MHTLTENPAATAQRRHDRALPRDAASYFRDDELKFEVQDMLKEPVARNGSRYNITDIQVEKFIVDLVAAPNRDIFLENYVGALPRASSEEFQLHVAVARQWVKNPEAVGEIVGPAFFAWAKKATLAAISSGWTAEDTKSDVLAHYTAMLVEAKGGAK